jgi:methionine biosynthesis protein MetW
MSTTNFDVTLKRYEHVPIALTNINNPHTLIINRIRPGAHVLEVGCADGYMSEALTALRSCTVTGIEINPDAADVARKYCRRVIVGDLEDGLLERIPDRFDVVTFADVLEHLRIPSTVLRQARALLADDGYIVISLPNIAHWEVRYRLLRGRFEYEKYGILDSTHLRFFTLPSARRFIEQAGFRITSVDVVHRWPQHWKYEHFSRRHDALFRRLTHRFFMGLFGYQFIFTATVA